MRLGLERRVVVVTGAASGIGLAAAQAFTDEGARVLAVDRDPGVHQMAAQLDDAIALEVDITAPDAAARVAEAAEEIGGAAVLVNNAASCQTRTGFAAVSLDAWRATFEVNLFAVVALSAALLPQLTAQHGVIINVASTSGRHPEPLLIDYAASKAALLSLTGALATEYGPQGVRVVAVSPGPTRTPLWDEAGGFIDGISELYGLEREAAVAHHIRDVRGVALGRAARAEDVAQSIVFVASDAARHISGTNLAVHGGMATHLM